MHMRLIDTYRYRHEDTTKLQNINKNVYINDYEHVELTKKGTTPSNEHNALSPGKNPLNDPMLCFFPRQERKSLSGKIHLTMEFVAALG